MDIKIVKKALTLDLSKGSVLPNKPSSMLEWRPMWQKPQLIGEKNWLTSNDLLSFLPINNQRVSCSANSCRPSELLFCCSSSTNKTLGWFTKAWRPHSFIIDIVLQRPQREATEPREEEEEDRGRETCSVTTDCVCVFVSFKLKDECCVWNRGRWCPRTLFVFRQWAQPSSFGRGAQVFTDAFRVLFFLFYFTNDLKYCNYNKLLS